MPKKPADKKAAPVTQKVSPEERSIMRAAIDARPDMTPWVRQTLLEKLDELDREALPESSASVQDGP